MINFQIYREIENEHARQGALADAKQEVDALRTRLAELYATEAAIKIREYFAESGPVQRIEFDYDEAGDGVDPGPSIEITAVHGPRGAVLYDYDADEGEPGYDSGFSSNQSGPAGNIAAALEADFAYFGRGDAGHFQHFLLPPA